MRDSYIYINIDLEGRFAAVGNAEFQCYFLFSAPLEWKYLQTQPREKDLDRLPSRYSDFTPYYLYSPLQIVRTGPREDRAEHVSLHWGHNVAAVSHFDEAAVDLRRLLASLILLALRIEQFASEMFTLM